MPSRRLVVPVALAAGGLLALLHVRVVRPWGLTWGATPEEVARRLPGDSLVERPAFDATRAITVRATPEQVWPWLVQAGTGRAGWYSYDLVDNLGRPSARRILPELQEIAVGDVIPMTPSGRLGLRVHSLDAPHAMVWGSPGETTWEWQLGREPDGSTRLVTRFRSRSVAGIPTAPLAPLLDVGDTVMMRRMLLTLRDRAEELARG